MKWKTNKDEDKKKLPPPPKPPSPKEEPEEKPAEKKEEEKPAEPKQEKTKSKKKNPAKKTAIKYKSKQAQLLAELIDTKIDARISPIEDTLSKMFKLLKRVKETAAPAKVMELENEILSIKEVLEDLNVGGLEEDVSSRFGQLSKKLLSSIKEHDAAIEDLEIKISSTKQESPGPKGSPDSQRDIESLKTKTHWLEMELEKLNLKPLIAKINELESRINTLKLQQPMIIE